MSIKVRKDMHIQWHSDSDVRYKDNITLTVIFNGNSQLIKVVFKNATALLVGVGC